MDDLTKKMSRLSTGKKATPSKKSRVPQDDDFSTGFTVPSLVYKYTYDNNGHVKVNFFVYPMKKENFQPKVVNDGLSLELRTEVPQMFFDAERVKKACPEDSYNKNIHEHTAFDEAVEKIKNEYEYEDENDKIYGPCQKFRLPYQCDLEIKHWEVQFHRHNDCPEEFYENTGSADNPNWNLTDHLYYAILVVELVSAEKKKNKTRGAQRRFI